MQLHGISYEGRFRNPPRLLPPMRRIALCPTRPSLDLDSPLARCRLCGTTTEASTDAICQSGNTIHGDPRLNYPGQARSPVDTIPAGLSAATLKNHTFEIGWRSPALTAPFNRFPDGANGQTYREEYAHEGK